MDFALTEKQKMILRELHAPEGYERVYNSTL